MEPDDIASLFFGDEASAPEQAAAMARALRGQQQMGQLGLLTGDKVLGNLGAHMLQGAGAREGLIAKAGTQLNQQRLQLAMAKQEQDAALAREKYSQGQQDYRQSQALNAGKYVQGPFGVLDTRTGELDPYAKPVAGLKPKDIDEQFGKLSDAVSTTRGRGSLNKENQQRLNNAERLETLILGPGGQIQNLTPQQVREAGTALAQLISSGSMSLGQIEELTPSTSAMQFANLKQRLLNEPQGADAQAFLRNMLETAGREKGVVLKQMRAGQLQGVPTYAHLRGVDAPRFESILRGAGIDPASVDENGLEKAVAEKVAGLAPDKAARLEELRRKKAAGQLK